MTLRKKSFWFTAVVSFVLIVIFSVLTIQSFNYFSMGTIREQGRMAAEMLRITLTEQMRTGVIEEREMLLKRMRTIPGLVDVRVMRGEPVIHQFGPGKNGEQARLDMEKRVLATGKWEESLIAVDDAPVYRITIPYIASSTGTLNCMQCHDVPEGAVNGAVTLGFSLEEMEKSEALAIVPIVLLLIVFGLALGYFLKRLLKPVVATAESLRGVVVQAEKGDFSGRITAASSDEIGEIATQTNNLMDTLEQSMGKISASISSLGDRTSTSNNGQNLLTHTVHVVDEMVGAARFKQAVEDDLDLDEIYARIRRVMGEHFELTSFSFYSIDGETEGLKPQFVEGVEGEAGLWCDPEILVSPQACRAKRTAGCVSSINNPQICSRFCGGEQKHVCIPMMLSGRVGGILQVVMSEDDVQRLPDIEQTASIYLNEAAPVIEARQLMQSLKDTAMRDPMTGLYNRRFLEDYIEVLAANTIRQKSTLGVLMVDVDFFKQVNDNYGHDVGDQVIKGLAELLKNTIRTSDLAIRFGGEEFMVLLPDTDADGCMLLAERIRKEMEGTQFATPQGSLKKTLSVGIALFPGEKSEGFWATVKFADIALYQAKEQGRNRTLMFESSMWDEGGEY
ncbi:diguanylate cyclase (GGDEF) domain-containing protein [Mariprofundus ferrinatatus]|uniref:diguanylate cyclase n=1 Tax=Mariprofundus ferrinatatus TaxID=1921087 RepID=A0A2K8L1Q6_9PROT|nr:diguanylate cyclase [Mariprofundus ferrinatatus]ATX81238.1 diguanylate cyclase (GGDEF) domain-containing protein [Mariprofundus ferrinatatus]